jgi:hypothetical protein
MIALQQVARAFFHLADRVFENLLAVLLDVMQRLATVSALAGMRLPPAGCFR